MRWIKLIYVTLLFILFGCGKNNHSQDKITIEPINALKEHNTAQWVKPGVESYGICVLQLEDEKHAKPIKIKILHVRSNEIKVKSIENITFEPNNNCEKTKVSYGETWWETDGDIYISKREALEAINKKGYILEK